MLGGDRRAVAGLSDDPRLRGYFGVAVERILTVPDPRLAVLRETPRKFRAIRVQLTEPARSGRLVHDKPGQAGRCVPDLVGGGHTSGLGDHVPAGAQVDVVLGEGRRRDLDPEPVPAGSRTQVSHIAISTSYTSSATTACSPSNPSR